MGSLNNTLDFTKSPLHDQLIKQIQEHTPEYNLYEHEWSFRTFLFKVLLYGLLGAIAGGLTERVLLELQGEDRTTQPRLKCAGFATLTLVIIAVLFYIVLRVASRYFDDWLLSTISGFMFALTYFDALQALGDNINCVFRK